jgi:NlpC/P60 family putative phage cell wall peptidase
MRAERIITEARSWIGTPYHHQASLKGIGCDCLGLLRGVWRAVIGEEPAAPPPYSPDWAEARRDDALVEAARRHLVEVEGGVFEAGDVLLFRFRQHLPAKHCAIAVTPARMVHAHDGAAVCEVAITPWWRRHLAGVFRFPALPARRGEAERRSLRPPCSHAEQARSAVSKHAGAS